MLLCCPVDSNPWFGKLRGSVALLPCWLRGLCKSELSQDPMDAFLHRLLRHLRPRIEGGVLPIHCASPDNTIILLPDLKHSISAVLESARRQWVVMKALKD